MMYGYGTEAWGSDTKTAILHDWKNDKPSKFWVSFEKLT